MTESVYADAIQHIDSGALYGKPGLSLIVVETSLCRAVIAEQGAQLLEFQGHGGQAMLWLSPLADFQPGKAVRGGIPLCLPWFGIHPDGNRPKHGLVRSRPWQLEHAGVLPGGEVKLVFTYRHSADALFASDFECRYTMILGKDLRLELELHHLGAAAADYGWAWHTYFTVDDVRAIEVSGLEGGEYLDNTRGLARARLDGRQTFPAEVDRVFENAPSRQLIETADPIETSSENCDTVITWNPGQALAATLADVGDHYREFVCVEHGNAFANRWHLSPGERRTARLQLSRS
ncbi:D-hexose-6-phosphate mutarotase [Microbulbifer guangxiensis]|uniref:D-hexose-6-phosphate mutarotase n=1 Tax=Microbulbifer guangxiensis TaxID=2904249 RepID=UPI001F1882EB|nr:D-hexose-6-phosphate mutarotase [Microbulbifer guangxiensis]